MPSEITTACDNTFQDCGVVQNTPYSSYRFGFSVSLINFVWPWKSKQKHVGCLVQIDLFFWVYYFSILLLSLNSANLLGLSQVNSISCLNLPCLFGSSCLFSCPLLLCSSLSLDIKTEASYLNMFSTKRMLLCITFEALNQTHSAGLAELQNDVRKSNSKIFHKTQNLSTQYLHNRNT